MKCTSCGGALDGNMTFCPFCGARADVDLQQIHFRDIGTDENLPCPDCTTPLGVIEFDTEPKTRIERCQKCLGMFFNPGELVFLLEASTNPLVWLDTRHLSQLAVDHEFNHEIIYLKCPVCAERMSHINFGGRSGVILEFIIDGTSIGNLERANTDGLNVNIDASAQLAISLLGVPGDYALGQEWTLMDYTTLSGQFAQGNSFTNPQGYHFAVDYGSGSNDLMVLTLVPESSAALLSLVSCGLLLRRRR